MASITGLTPSPASATSGPPVAAAATPPPSATNGTTAAAVVPSGAVHTLHQEPFVPGQVVDYEEITVPPLYDAERAKGDIRVRVPKRVMQYRPRYARLPPCFPVILCFACITAVRSVRVVSLIA